MAMQKSMDAEVLRDGDTGFTGMDTRRPNWHLESGLVVLSQNGRMTGDWKPRKGVDVVLGAVRGGSPLRLPFLIIDAPAGIAIVSMVRTGSLVTVTVPFVWSSGPSYVTVTGFTGYTVNPNGAYLMTVTGSTTATFTIFGATGNETYTVVSNVTILTSIIDDSSSADVLGSCLFSDPSTVSEEYCIMALGADARRVKLSDGSFTALTYPGSTTITGDCSLIQAFDKVLLFQAGQVTMELAAGSTAFTFAPSGVYTQPIVFSTTGGQMSVASGLVTVGITGNTGLNVIAPGNMITIFSSADNRFTSLVGVGKSYQCKTASSTQVTFFAPVADSAASGTAIVQLGKSVSVGGGFGYSTRPPFATYFQRRLWTPYQYDPVTGVDRLRKDELVVSDILDSNTFDLISNQFRITAGIADGIVGFHPFTNDTMLVFCRNSVHSVTGASGALRSCVVAEVTREVGCLARRTIVTQGDSIFFLSDAGVYGLQFQDFYNLRGLDKPLSDTIDSVIERVNERLAVDSVAIYFDNKYFLACPLDSTSSANDATGNNTIIVYNTLNSAYESIDTYGDPDFLVTNLFVGRASGKNSLYCVTKSGGVHIMDKLDSSFDRISVNTTTGATQIPISSKLKSRGYVFGDMGRKRLMQAGVVVRGGTAASDFEIVVSTDDPDGTTAPVMASATLGNLIDAGNTADIRTRAGGLRGQNGSVTITPKVGRPSIRAITLSATATNGNGLSQQ